MMSMSEYIKHCRHFDGLGMGDAELESQAKALEARVKELEAANTTHMKLSVATAKASQNMDTMRVRIEELEADLTLEKSWQQVAYATRTNLEQRIEELEAALRHIAEGTWWDGHEPWEFHRVEIYALAVLQENE